MTSFSQSVFFDTDFGQFNLPNILKTKFLGLKISFVSPPLAGELWPLTEIVLNFASPKVNSTIAYSPLDQ